jgi:hypothetical protein
MTIFTILMPSAQPSLTEAIKKHYASDNYPLTDTQWLVSSKETAAEVSNKLGITGPPVPDTPVHIAVVFATSSYFGRAPATVWDWIKVKLESSPSA